MLYINHRINTAEALEKVPKMNGVELDIRYHENDLVLEHDPFSHHERKPQKFADYLLHYRHEGPLVLNIKTEGIEEKCMELMRGKSIENWMFLDLSMPYFVMYARKAKNREIAGFSPKNLMVRYSEFEPLEYALAFTGMAEWVWVDCFTKLPLDKTSYELLKNAGFKICIVSPELQKHPVGLIAEFKRLLAPFEIDAVCTKQPELWR